MQLVGWVVFSTAMLFVVLHRDAARAYLRAYRAAHRNLDPGASWLVHRDPDPEVERLRRKRLLLVVPASACVLVGIFLIVYAPR